MTLKTGVMAAENSAVPSQEYNGSCSHGNSKLTIVLFLQIIICI